MGLFKRGSVWWMSFIYQGKQIKKSTETDDKQLAKRIFDKVKGEVAEQKWFEKSPGEDRTFKELMAKYMAEHSARNKALSSHKRGKSLGAHLLRSFGSMILGAITPKLISDYKTKRREEGAAPATINGEIGLMRHAFNLAINDWEWIKDNPAKRVSREKVNNQIERWLTLEEERKVLNSSPEWLQEIILFALNTGLRLNEILDLKWARVDLSRRTIAILEQKNQSKDTLPLNEISLRILEARAEDLGRGDVYVFHTRNGTRIAGRNLQQAFCLAVKRARIEKFRFHDLRHTFATRLIQAGVDIYTVQKLGRWKSISMVMRYAHHHPESLRSGVEVLDRLGQKFSTNLEQSKEKGATASA